MSEAGKVPVYILTASEKSPLGQRVYGYFSDDYFDKNRVIVQDPNPDGLKYSQNSIELYRIRKALEHAEENYPTGNTIIIKDTSVTSHSPTEIVEYIKKINNTPEWGLFYLTVWQDKCKDRKHKGTFGDKNIGIPKDPHGFQALMFTPHTRDIILGKKPLPNGKWFELNENFSETLRSYIHSGQMVPYFVSPNIFSFDNTLAKTPEDIAKLNECMDLESYQQDLANNAQSPTNWLWIIVAFALFVALLYFLMKRRP